MTISRHGHYNLPIDGTTHATTDGTTYGMTDDTTIWITNVGSIALQFGL